MEDIVKYQTDTAKHLKYERLRPTGDIAGTIKHPRDLIDARDSVAQVAQQEDLGVIQPVMQMLRNPDNYSLFFAREDFPELLSEMMSTITLDQETVNGMMDDIVAEQGDHGCFIIGFDDRHVPSVDATINVKLPEHNFAFGRTHEAVVSTEMSIRTCWIALVWMLDAQGTLHTSSVLMPHETERLMAVSTVGVTKVATLISWMMLAGQAHFFQTVEVAAGAGLPPKIKKQYTPKTLKTKITVIDLRRTVRTGIRDVQEAEHRHLDHRFIVRGHWRKQPVGIGRRDRRLVFVAPYIKGPEGAPFVKREKVFKF